ncbi:MAG: S-layer homology domain-containing protein [Chloroflexota bacterium]|nr:S-layer homology domain-containing protein [Chloroflexota bacterium]
MRHKLWAIATGLLVVLAGLRGAPLLPAHAATATGPATRPATAVVSLGRFMVDAADYVVPDQAAQMQAGGVQAVRVAIPWSRVEPTHSSPPQYDWRVTDNTMQILHDHGLTALVTLTGNPTWASGSGTGPVDRVPESVYYDWVSAAAARYSGPTSPVRAWEIYNEEDSITTWGNRPADFIRVLSTDYSILKAANPATAVIMGGLAYDSFTDECPNPLDCQFVRAFLPNFLAQGGGAYTDAINFHYYTNGTWAGHYGAAAGLGVVVSSLRSTLTTASLTRPLIWTEGSISSNPKYGGSDAAQTAYVVKAYARTYGLALDQLCWFPYQDYADSGDYSYFSSHGLTTPSGAPKPSYTAYRLASGYLSTATLLRVQDASELGGNAGAAGYAFARPDGTGLMIAWDDSGTGHSVWPAAHVRAVKDAVGQPVAYSVANGQATVALTSSPVYIELDQPSRFRDIPLDFWAQPFVEYLSGQGAVSGYSDGTFRPLNNATRGQISKILVAAVGITDTITSGQQTFADVPATNVFWLPIERMAGRGIVGGYGCGTTAGEPCDGQHRPYFRPANNVTRAQLSKMITLARGWTPVDPASGPQHFTDVPPSNGLYGFIEAVYGHGVVAGYGCGSVPAEPCDATSRAYFRPVANASRAQLSKMIYIAVTQP